MSRFRCFDYFIIGARCLIISADAIGIENRVATQAPLLRIISPPRQRKEDKPHHQDTGRWYYLRVSISHRTWSAFLKSPPITFEEQNFLESVYYRGREWHARSHLYIYISVARLVMNAPSISAERQYPAPRFSPGHWHAIAYIDIYATRCRLYMIYIRY